MSESWQKKLPMLATTSRILVAPIIFIVLTLKPPFFEWFAVVLFVLGSLTDWLDGYWARKYDAHTNMGKFMDPIADKILTLSVLVLLVGQQRIGPVAPVLLLSRDIFIGGLRSIAAADQVIIAAKATGKWKTGLQMVFIPCLFVDVEVFGVTLQTLGQIGLWLSVVLSLASGLDYTLSYYRGARKA